MNKTYLNWLDIEDENVVLNESAGVLQYAQTCFEGLKAYTTVDNKIVTFRPDMNAQRMMDSCSYLEMPVFEKEKFIVKLLTKGDFYNKTI